VIIINNSRYLLWIKRLLNEKQFVKEDKSVTELEVFEKEKLLDSFV
jgi:hypothetical protein